MKKRIILSMIICLAVALCIAIPRLTYNGPSEEYRRQVEKYSRTYGVEENFIYAIIKTESDFQPDAVSEAGAIGLMQMTEETFDWIKWRTDGDEEFDDLFKPEISIKYGTYYLRFLIDEFGDYRTVAIAYHSGSGSVKKWLADSDCSSDGKTLDKTPSRKANHYAAKVMGHYEEYCGEAVSD